MAILKKIPENKNNLTQEDLNNILQESINIVKDLGFKLIDINPKIFVNNITTEGGSCRIKNNIAKIYIAEMMLSTDIKILKQTILHEVCHSIIGTEAHDEIWYEAINQINEKYGYNIRCSNTFEELGLNEDDVVKPPNYILICPKCNETFEYYNMTHAVKYPEEYECAECREKLKRIK